ncbi:6-phosphofructo-2-kinase 1 [Komagataella phaffii CBS 7435]|uniref:6-phosphofructo-2-kinase domain-containing protein n=2 Tax=Komagataella phaffii TaxID=460519 RepID=C4R191_KOMPG|nr:uncharacterized protein PAS_chr2-1_0870 [Komagataella phaffii GS115]AOA62344.1 GQ67_00684T0 [Komagataella phaffii]CAH2448208.1 6-phosphofructo-2-kinase 1 [Komagataella phaffii CBS 7435]AOA67330.1 GQ68_00704T0 [Komagataella phaffii GS115]CAY69265.1 hypothetical protein PAS_chr2-1_0870 [Komagataella phaffii GS115]CCA38345.1 6-phosphofructo-2-kinase 1 [Komagataella phaffii CBS 7435]
MDRLTGHPDLDDEYDKENMKLIIVCVGLPARGKSYITKKLTRYLSWLQYTTKIFNVGNTRRTQNGKPSSVPVDGPRPKAEASNHHDSAFFDPYNDQFCQLREKWAMDTLDELLDFLLYKNGNVGIFDATNTTKSRRRWVVEHINQRTNGDENFKVLFLESICTDKQIIEKNIRLKLSGPDYINMDQHEALKDFKDRLRNYEKVYETIDDQEEEENERYNIQYLKIINAGKKIVSYNINGYLSSHTVFYLLNFNLAERQIWLTTNGETEYNLQNRIGGDSKLSNEGWKFAKALPKFIAQKRKEFQLRQLTKHYIETQTPIEDVPLEEHTKPVKYSDLHFHVWSSALKRSTQSTTFFPSENYSLKQFRTLNDLCCGSLDGLTEQEFKSKYKEEYQNSQTDKLSFSFPGIGGESYLDVINRLRPLIVELERLPEHVLVITHRVIVRILLGYFMNLDRNLLTDLEILHGYVYCIEPKPYGLDLKIWQYDEADNEFNEVDKLEFMKRRRKSINVNTTDFRMQLNKELQQDALNNSPGNNSPGVSSLSSYSSSSSLSADGSEGETLIPQVSQAESYNFEFNSLSSSVSSLKRTTSSSQHLSSNPSCLSMHNASLDENDDEHLIDPASTDDKLNMVLQDKTLIKKLKSLLLDEAEG